MFNSPSAPLRVPVEIRLAGRRGARWFRLAEAVSESGLLFPRPLPDDFDPRAPLEITFHLPEDAQPIRLDARAIDAPAADAPDEDRPPARRAVAFLFPDEDARARIARYVELRLVEI